MHKDGLELLRAFAAREVRYLLVGAHAVSYWAEPRATGDVDLLIEPTPENAARAYTALADFGAPLLDLEPSDLATPGTVYQMGVAPYRIDVITELTGVSFAEAWEEHRVGRFQDLEVPIIGFAALERNKRATGRDKDLLDLELLARHRPQDD